MDGRAPPGSWSAVGEVVHHLLVAHVVALEEGQESSMRTPGKSFGGSSS